LLFAQSRLGVAAVGLFNTVFQCYRSPLLIPTVGRKKSADVLAVCEVAKLVRRY
jgi:hypothetical protein